MKKLSVVSCILFICLFISSCGSSPNYENPAEVSDYLVKHAYKATENDVEVVLHFFKSGEGSLTAYLNGLPTGKIRFFILK